MSTLTQTHTMHYHRCTEPHSITPQRRCCELRACADLKHRGAVCKIASSTLPTDGKPGHSEKHEAPSWQRHGKKICWANVPVIDKQRRHDQQTSHPFTLLHFKCLHSYNKALNGLLHALTCLCIEFFSFIKGGGYPAAWKPGNGRFRSRKRR